MIIPVDLPVLVIPDSLSYTDNINIVLLLKIPSFSLYLNSSLSRPTHRKEIIPSSLSYHL